MAQPQHHRAGTLWYVSDGFIWDDLPAGYRTEPGRPLECSSKLFVFNPHNSAANVTARFRVLDEAAQRQLLDRLTLEVLTEAAADPESALGRALASATAVAADQTFREVVNEAIGARDLVIDWIERAGSIEAAIGMLCEQLAISSVVGSPE